MTILLHFTNPNITNETITVPVTGDWKYVNDQYLLIKHYFECLGWREE